MERLVGTVAVVAGGSSGMGFATAKLFAAEAAYELLQLAATG